MGGGVRPNGGTQLPAALPSKPDPESLRRLKAEIEAFLRFLAHPVLVEDEIELFDLTAARCQLTVEFGKLLLEVSNPGRSIVRRVEAIAYRDGARLGIFARKPGGRETGTIEFRSFDRTQRTERAAGRSHARRELVALLGREFPGVRFERVSNRSDREHSFSTWYTRGWARQGRTAWAFLGLSEDETLAAGDAALAFGLIWLDWLRARSEPVTVSGLKLFLPRAAAELTAQRAAGLNRRALRLEVFEWRAGGVRPVDLADFGNIETRLPRCLKGEALSGRQLDVARKWLGDLAERIDLVADASGNVLSLRVLGLEIARLEDQLAAQIYWGLEGSVERLDEGNRQASRDFIAQVLELRQPESRDPAHDYFRLQSERWLESLLIRDLTKIDPALSPECVYPQVPAVAGRERGVIDVLGVTRAGRLAVIELKLVEEISLPIQGLDYWLRVRWLLERRQFQAAGYFPGRELAAAPPLLYLVSPAFRFHSTTGHLLRYLDPSIEIVQVGINDGWRRGIKVLFRRDARVTP